MQQIGFALQVPFIPSEDDSVRLLFEVTEGLDFTDLYKTYSTLGRNPAIDPAILFKILIYGCMNKIYSSRDLEKACKRDINFIWLLQGQKAPDHNTIARFRSKHLQGCISDLFNQLIAKLGEMNEIRYENLFIDGTKIEANANKYTFVWKKATDKFESKLQEKIKKTFEEIHENLDIRIANIDQKISVDYASKILDKLENIKKENSTEFVYGKGKRKSKLQKYYESIQEFIEKQIKYDNYNSIFDGRNSFSKTDKDATFMHMKDDHMQNGQLKPGYNIQIGVEGEYIVGIDISSERSDQLTFIPFLDKLEKDLPKKFENVIADAGYESEENYMYLSKHNQKSYIKPQNYEKSKNKKFKVDISKRENMIYDEENDYYICAYGNKLVPISSKIKTSKSGYKSNVTIYESENCNECPYKSKCTKAKGNKRLHVSKDFVKKRKTSLENISTEKGKLLSSHTISKGWSSPNRNTNMKVAENIINGKENKGYILMPGKTFSWLKVVGNTTKEKGFKIAPVIVNRRHAEGYGGGVCQVASTLNSAIVDANLETHALKHSLPSSYIGPNDHEATVSYDSGKDLSFKNTFKFPINIKVSTTKGAVTVKVFKMKKKTKIIKVKNDAVDR